MKILHYSALLLLLFCSCYKANNPPKSNETPFFNIRLYSSAYGTYEGGDFMYDSILLKVKKNKDATITIDASIASGNPENFPIVFRFCDLPAGISFTEDSFSFKLNWHAETTMKVLADKGRYVFNVNITTSQGSTKYPVNLHVDL